MEKSLGYTEGDVCGRSGCEGTIDVHPSENCSCHIAPPCWSCTSPRNFCPVCGWEEKDDPLVIMEVHTIYVADGFVERRKRVLDSTKIDYRIEAHSNSSQKVIGVFPPGTTREQVRARVDGTFGGRFEKFDETSGQFVFVAYTD